MYPLCGWLHWPCWLTGALKNSVLTYLLLVSNTTAHKIFLFICFAEWYSRRRYSQKSFVVMLELIHETARVYFTIVIFTHQSFFFIYQLSTIDQQKIALENFLCCKHTRTYKMNCAYHTVYAHRMQCNICRKTENKLIKKIMIFF